MKYKTFNVWSELGYRIKKGAKSEKRNKENIPLFSEDQVYEVEQLEEEYERELDDIFELSYCGKD